jgi:hypothetical protein
MKAWRLVVALIVCAASLRAQEVKPGVKDLLDKLYAYSQEYRMRLPSLECDELITSQLVIKGKVRKEVKIEGLLRNVRVPDEKEPFTETHVFKRVDDETLPPVFKFRIPYFVKGGFANAVGFAAPEKRDCYDYTVTSLDLSRVKLEMVVRRGDQTPVCREVPEAYQKTVIADPVTGRIFSVEQMMSAKAAKRLKEPYFAAVTYKPQRLGDDTLWLPTTVRSHEEKNERRMTAVYSNFHRYAATVTIQGASGVSEP